ncbi:MAG: cytochrome P450 [Pseudomonadota bacterium]|nr:cytochrome P450 [Pseudomonadota bacterium]
MPDNTLFAQVLDRANRADPYPLYARLRETPVIRVDDGTYIVSTYAEIRGLLHEPRLSSDDLPKPKHARTGNPLRDFIINPVKDWIIETHRPLIFRDPPDHAILRRLVMAQFTPERVWAINGRVGPIVEDLIRKMRGREDIDLVGRFSYPLSVTVICEVLGIPPGDAPKFQSWSRTLAGVLDPDQWTREEDRLKSVADWDALTFYLSALVREKRKRPAGDVLSGLAANKDKKLGRMGKYDLIATAVLLLVAGHETTVNLIANGMLTLLRNPQWLERLRQDPALAPRVVEELLRFEPPVHFRTRKALAAIDIAGTAIPKGAPLVLLFASGNRDPKRFAHPDRFDPERADNPHFGFGGGLHYCLGATLARLEAEAALVALAKRLVDPRLLEDPPPYRPGASVRGPEHLMLGIAGVVA